MRAGGDDLLRVVRGACCWAIVDAARVGLSLSREVCCDCETVIRDPGMGPWFRGCAPLPRGGYVGLCGHGGHACCVSALIGSRCENSWRDTACIGRKICTHAWLAPAHRQLQRHAESTAFSAACSPTVRTWLCSLPRTVGRPEPPQGGVCSGFHGFERPSDLLVNRRKRGALAATGAMTDGLGAAALLQLARMLAAASSEAAAAAQSDLCATLTPWYSPSLQCTASYSMACSVRVWWNAAYTAQIVVKQWPQ